MKPQTKAVLVVCGFLVSWIRLTVSFAAYDAWIATGTVKCPDGNTGQYVSRDLVARLCDEELRLTGPRPGGDAAAFYATVASTPIREAYIGTTIVAYLAIGVGLFVLVAEESQRVKKFKPEYVISAVACTVAFVYVVAANCLSGQRAREFAPFTIWTTRPTLAGASCETARFEVFDLRGNPAWEETLNALRVCAATTSVVALFVTAHRSAD